MCLVKTYLPWLNIVIYQKHLIIKPSFTDQAQFSSINRKKVVHFLFNCVPLWLKSGRCSRPQVSSVTCSYWTVQAATPWARPTTPLPPGAAALCLKPSPLAPCTAQASFPPTAPRHRAGTAPDCRTPWRLNILAPWEGRGSQAVFSIWPQRPAVCTPQCPTTCWTPTARIWPPHRSTALQGCTPIRPGSTPRTRPKCAASFAYPRQVSPQSSSNGSSQGVPAQKLSHQHDKQCTDRPTQMFSLILKCLHRRQVYSITILFVIQCCPVYFFPKYPPIVPKCKKG